MTMTIPRHAAPQSDTPTQVEIAETDVPVTVRVAGVRLRTARAYEQLRAEAAATGWRGRLARRRLATEERCRKRAISRICEMGGWDIDAGEPGPRGSSGPGGGRTNVVPRLPEWRATTSQVAGGFWPFSVGATSPMLGTPLGSHLYTGQDFGCDPLTWFLSGLITAPIAFVLALNGFGKSSLVRRMALGNIAQGHTSLFLGDVKPDFAELTKMVDGQIITGGYGDQTINPLDVGALGTVLAEIRDSTPWSPQSIADMTRRVEEDLRSRQVSTVAGLVEINRGTAIRDFEETLLGSALEQLYRPIHDGGQGFTGQRPPILEDLYRLIRDGNAELWEDTAARTAEEYRASAAELCRSLRALTSGRLGKVLNGHTTTPIDPSSPAVCIDVSRVPKGDRKLKAALLLVCWADGFGAVEAAHVRADAGRGPRRTFQVIIDELWQVIGSGAGIVDRVDALVRLNRSDAVSLIMVTHSVNDLSAFESQADAAKAIGFLEKAQIKFIGPVGPEEIERLSQVTAFNAQERALITSAASTPPPSEDALAEMRRQLTAASKSGSTSVERPRPHGQGVFVAKLGTDDRAGIPFRMIFTPAEAEGGVHNTNARFDGVLKKAS